MGNKIINNYNNNLTQKQDEKVYFYCNADAVHLWYGKSR